jgi:hypothetical protein
MHAIKKDNENETVKANGLYATLRIEIYTPNYQNPTQECNILNNEVEEKNGMPQFRKKIYSK